MSHEGTLWLGVALGASAALLVVAGMILLAFAAVRYAIRRGYLRTFTMTTESGPYPAPTRTTETL